MLTIALTVDDLRKRQDPLFSGVEIESRKSNILWPGWYCSAGFPVMYSASGGSLGFMIASHCTEPYDPAYRVYQLFFSISASDFNYAGWADDRGTNDVNYETDLNQTRPCGG